MDNQLMLQWIKNGQLSVPKLLLDHYTKIGLNEAELTMLLHVQAFINEGYSFPTPEQLANRMTYTEVECTQMLQRLLKKGLLELQDLQDESNVLYESYTLDPLWEQLIFFLQQEQGRETEDQKQSDEGQLYGLFEREFSRPLSPIESETLMMWIDQDHHSPLLIKAALKEAVVSGKLNFRYIDRILFEWQKNGVRTVEQAKAYGEKFRKYQQKGQQPKRKPNTTPFPEYNWLEQ